MALSLTTLAVLLAVAFARQDTPSISATSPEATAVLSRARIHAVGVDDDLVNSGTLRITGTVQVQQMPLKGTFVELHHPAGQARMGWTFTGFGETVEGSDGGVFYEVSPMGVDVRRGWRAAAAYRILALRRHVVWKVLYEQAVLDGFADVAGERCHKLLMTPKSPVALGFAEKDEELEPRPAPDVWYVGATTGILHRVDLVTSVPNAGPGTLSLGFGDWREVGGMRFPHRLTRSMHGYGMESLVEKIEHGLELTPESLALPERVQKEVGAKAAPGALPDPGFAVTTATEQHAATIRVKCKPAEVSRTLASILPEVGRYLGEVGATPAGPPFTRYHAVGADELDIEAGMPVTAPIEARGRILASKMPGGRVVKGNHIGEYHRLSETHAALAKWLAAKGEVAVGGAYEVYWTDPGVEPDPRKWRTEIVQAVQPK